VLLLEKVSKDLRDGARDLPMSAFGLLPVCCCSCVSVMKRLRRNDDDVEIVMRSRDR
jgi:hypothetical protein